MDIFSSFLVVLSSSTFCYGVHSFLLGFSCLWFHLFSLGGGPFVTLLGICLVFLSLFEAVSKVIVAVNRKEEEWPGMGLAKLEIFYPSNLYRLVNMLLHLVVLTVLVQLVIMWVIVYFSRDWIIYVLLNLSRILTGK